MRWDVRKFVWHPLAVHEVRELDGQIQARI